AKEVAEGVKKEMKGDIEGLVSQYNEQKKALDNLQDQTDKLEVAAKRLSAGKEKKETPWESIGTTLKDNPEMLENVKSGKTEIITMGQKALTLTGDVFQEDWQSGINLPPSRPVFVRNLLGAGTTSASSIAYLREVTPFSGYDTVAPGGTKPELSGELERVDSPVRKIAGWIRVPDEWLDDIPGLTSYLRAQLPIELKKVEDTQLLYGSGTGNDLQGITGVANAYVDDTGNPEENMYDVLIEALSQLRSNEYMADAILVNPSDYYDMLRWKTSGSGEYDAPVLFVSQNGVARLAGVPIIANNGVTADDFVVGNFASGGQVFDRMRSNVQFYRQDQDTVITNQVTVVAEERLALAIYRTSAFVYGQFSTAL